MNVKHMITIDMRKRDGSMQVYLGDVDIEPNVNMSMDIETFDALCAKTISGFRAFMTGKIKFTGSLGDVKKWDNEVSSKYLDHIDEEVCILGL